MSGSEEDEVVDIMARTIPSVAITQQTSQTLVRLMGQGSAVVLRIDVGSRVSVDTGRAPSWLFGHVIIFGGSAIPHRVFPYPRIFPIPFGLPVVTLTHPFPTQPLDLPSPHLVPWYTSSLQNPLTHRMFRPRTQPAPSLSYHSLSLAPTSVAHTASDAG